MLKADPDSGTTRTDGVVGVQELFVDKHLRNVSERYDFDSLRVGIQPFTSDFRGFLFQDSRSACACSARAPTTATSTTSAWFRRIEKDTNSGLNDARARSDACATTTSSSPTCTRRTSRSLGFTAQATVIYNRNREGDEIVYDDNGFIQRPASIGLERGARLRRDVRRAERRRPLRALEPHGVACTAPSATADARHVRRPAAGHRGGLRRGRSLARLRLDPRARLGRLRQRRRGSLRRQVEGFDAIFENPLFAGADTSFWIRQPMPLIGGGACRALRPQRRC